VVQLGAASGDGDIKFTVDGSQVTQTADEALDFSHLLGTFEGHSYMILLSLFLGTCSQVTQDLFELVALVLHLQLLSFQSRLF
jgi:hypothetical protein